MDGGITMLASPCLRRSTALSSVAEAVARCCDVVNDVLPVGREQLELSHLLVLSEMLSGEPRASALLRSRVREMEQPGSRFGRAAETDVITTSAFADFVRGVLRTPLESAWEVLEVRARLPPYPVPPVGR